MKYFILWFHRVQFALLAGFSTLVLLGSLMPGGHDLFIVAYGASLLSLSIIAIVLLESRKALSFLLIAIIDLILPLGFFSFFANGLPTEADVKIFLSVPACLLLWTTLAVLTIRNRKSFKQSS